MRIKGYLVHLCLIDLHCWKTWWRYGAPMRLHLGKWFWTIPGFGWRHNQVWKDAEPMRLLGSCVHCGRSPWETRLVLFEGREWVCTPGNFEECQRIASTRP